MDLSQLVLKFGQEFVTPAIGVLVGAALVVFLWGVVEFIQGAESESARTTGKRHMFWGIAGLFIMVAAYAILSLASDSIWGAGF